MKRNFGHEDAGLATVESLDSVVENTTISEFLRTNQKRYIVGPKGSGKTLLLLRKAIDQRAMSGSICIPSDAENPVDRLAAAQHVGRRFNYIVSDEGETNLAWAAVWKHSIYRSVIHHLRDIVIEELQPAQADAPKSAWARDVENSRFQASRRLIDSYLSDLVPTPRGPYYYYTELGSRLDSAGHGALASLAKENLELDALVQLVQRPIFIFLDNLDDYYEREPELWFNSMYGQFRAIREISLTHRHIHVFTSIRSDVFSHFSDEMRLQYYDYVAELNYSKTDLQEIFEAHIRELEDDLLAEPHLRQEDPWRALFGEVKTIRNGIVGVSEWIWNYLHRHTLGRPRDLIHTGTVMLDSRPSGGFSVDIVRESVADAREDIAKQYLKEVAPMLDGRFDIETFVKSFLPGNVLTPGEVEDARETFIASQPDGFVDLSKPSDLTRPFETLHALGLLGAVLPKPDSTELIQTFRSPSRGLPSAAARELPDAEFYLLHPVLCTWLPPHLQSNEVVVGDKLPFTRHI